MIPHYKVLASQCFQDSKIQVDMEPFRETLEDNSVLLRIFYSHPPFVSP